MTAMNDVFPQGNPRDLLAVLNQFFAPQATTARLAYHPDHWRILLEAQETPDRNTCLRVLRKFFQQVTLPPGIEVYGRQRGHEAPAWGVRIKPRAIDIPQVAVTVPTHDGTITSSLGIAADGLIPQSPPSSSWSAPCALISSLGLLLTVGMGLWWLSPGTWIEQSASPEPSEIRQTITARAKDLGLLTPAPVQPRILPPPPMFRGKTIHRVTLPSTDKIVALTFDDGPDPKFTPQILDILKREQIKATFFVIGRSVEAYPELTQRIASEGHIVVNHSWSHRYHQFSPAEAAAEIEGTSAVIEQVTGQPNYWFRPPGGRLDNGLVQYAHQQGQAVLMWSVDPRDWEPGRSAGSITRTVLKDTRPGGIVLLHDGGGPRQATVHALPGIIQQLRQQGYRFATIPDLLQHQADHHNPTPHPNDWLGLTSIEQLQRLQAHLETTKAELHQALFYSSPLDIEQRQALANRYQTLHQAHSWITQRLIFELKAQGAWESALIHGQQAAAAGQAQDYAQAKTLWQKALWQLESIPERAFVAPAVPGKHAEYHRNFALIQERWEKQQSAFLEPIAQAAGLSETAAISLRDAAGNFYTRRGDMVPGSAASLIKLPLAVVSLHWAQQQPLSLAQPLTISAANYTEDASQIRSGQTYPLKTVVAEMIRRSSNMAPNQLMDRLGWDYINAVIQGYGYSSIKIYSKLVGQNRQPANLGRQANGASMRDLSQLMGQIYQNQLPQAPFLREILAQQQDRELGYAALKNSGAEWLGEKTGQNSLVLGTVLAFKVRGQTYTLAMMDSSRTSVAQFNQAIRKIADYVVQHPEQFSRQS